MRILFLTKYGELGASSRMRFFQYIPWLRAEGISPVVLPLIGDRMLMQKYKQGHYRWSDLLSTYIRRIRTLLNSHEFDLVWIEKEALPWFPAWFEEWLLRKVPYILDYDDAIFHNYDQHRSAWIRRIYGQRLDRLMSGAISVIAGNSYLAARATSAGAKRVEVIPTVVDLPRYTPKQEYAVTDMPRIVWIGSPSTVRYLMDLVEPLSALAKRQPFILRVIGGEITLPGVEVEILPWSLATEASLIADCDIGIMPLHNTPWEQGKCAYKLIQYMACSLPVVASPVGVNKDIVDQSVNGFLAQDLSDWELHLTTLLESTKLRKQLGLEGRRRVENYYSLQAQASRLEQLLYSVVRKE